MAALFRIFIIEDDIWYSELLQYQLGLNPDYEIFRFTTGKEALDALHLKPNLVTLDFSLPDYDGETILKKIKEVNSHIDIIIISGQEDVGTAVHLLKLGAYDYIIKDEETNERLWNSVLNAREKQALRSKVDELLEEVGIKHQFDQAIKGQSPAIKQVFNMLEKAVKTNITVMINGETGTGKELVAKALHYNSDRKKKNFIAVNMAAIPKDLIESELFGYEKGAFTGANSRFAGKFEEANHGTLFLDEIAEMDLTLQSKLLRVLQERELHRLGGNETIKVDFRLLVATHKDLKEEVVAGRFREDLYYRIIGIPVSLPPLRERGADSIILAKHFIQEFCKANKLKGKTIGEAAKKCLLAYHWPGNIRELKSVVETAVALSDADELSEVDFIFQGSLSKRTSSSFDIDKPLKEYETEIIAAAIKRNGGNIVLTAEKLEISKSKIYQLIKNGDLIV